MQHLYWVPDWIPLGGRFRLLLPSAFAHVKPRIRFFA
jgi:hypothetical protein